MMKEFAARRKLIVDGLRNLKGVECSLPGGSFFAFPNVKGTGLDGEEFTEHCLQKAFCKQCSVNSSPSSPVPLTLGNAKKDPPGKLHSTPFKFLKPSTISFLLAANSFIILLR